MAKFTILLALVALFALTAAMPQVNFADGPSNGGVSVADGPGYGGGQVNIVDGEHQVNFADGPSGPQPRDGPARR